MASSRKFGRAVAGGSALPPRLKAPPAGVIAGWGLFRRPQAYHPFTPALEKPFPLCLTIFSNNRAEKLLDIGIAYDDS